MELYPLITRCSVLHMNYYTCVFLKVTDGQAVWPSVGEIIRELRLQADLTQSELAKRLGVSISTVNKYEHHGQLLTIEAVANIARVLNVDLLIGFQT